VTKISTTVTERSDPAAGVEHLRASERRRRITAGLVLGALAAAVAFAAGPLTGSPGASVGAVVAAIVLCLLTVAIWPTEWSDNERAHHELSLIWRQARVDPDDEHVAWERYAAWAEPSGEDVELQLIGCAPVAENTADPPSPFSRLVVRRLSGEDMERAADAMEQLRDEAADRELRARERHELADVEAANRASDERLGEIDREAAAELEARERRLRREFAEREAAERRAQAEALARALLRP
jgi:hypothetical protein